MSKKVKTESKAFSSLVTLPTDKFKMHSSMSRTGRKFWTDGVNPWTNWSWGREKLEDPSLTSTVLLACSTTGDSTFLFKVHIPRKLLQPLRFLKVVAFDEALIVDLDAIDSPWSHNFQYKLSTLHIKIVYSYYNIRYFN